MVVVIDPASTSVSASISISTSALPALVATATAATATAVVSELTALPTPEDFYKDYVRTRQPVIFRSSSSSCHSSSSHHHNDNNNNDVDDDHRVIQDDGIELSSELMKIMTLDNIKQKVGKTQVEVNQVQYKNNNSHQDIIHNNNNNNNNEVTMTTTTTTKTHTPTRTSRPPISFSPAHSRVVTMPCSDFIDHILLSSSQNKTIKTTLTTLSTLHQDTTTTTTSDKINDKNNNNNDNKSYDYNYYMTTQTLPLDDEGRPALYTSPVKELMQDKNDKLKKGIPLRPTLLGNLIPMTYNLWIGRNHENDDDHDDDTTTTTSVMHHSDNDNDKNNNNTNKNNNNNTNNNNNNSAFASASSSSGWHHDYHDNLYILLEGQKQFQLARPDIVHQVKMQGTLHTLHSNGRIVYKEQLESSKKKNNNNINNNLMMMSDEIRPDGALASVEQFMALEIQKEIIERQLFNLEKQNDDDNDHNNNENRSLGSKDNKGNRIENDNDNFEKKKQELEDQLNDIEEQLLEYELKMEHDDDDSDGSHDTTANGNVNAKHGCHLFGGKYTNDDEEEDDDDNYDDGDDHVDINDDEDACDDDDVESHDDDQNKDGNDKNGSSDNLYKVEPPTKKTKHSHCISPAMTSTTLPLNFCLEDPPSEMVQIVTLNKGDMLYLPAGWFHEVTSMTGLHMAFNYWMHPPDVECHQNHDKDDNHNDHILCFDKPYRSQFWLRDWNARGLE